MQIHRGVTAAGLSGLLLFVAHLAAQGPQQTPPAGAPQTPAPQAPAPQAPAPQPPAGRGQGRGGVATFPAQQRPPGDPGPSSAARRSTARVAGSVTAPIFAEATWGA
jgi:hypothetical protein